MTNSVVCQSLLQNKLLYNIWLFDATELVIQINGIPAAQQLH
jgi:hypothetical protein